VGKRGKGGVLHLGARARVLTLREGRAKYAPLAETTGEDVALAERLLTSS